ncbi:protein kinase [Lachnospiraceae bacterium 46-15]
MAVGIKNSERVRLTGQSIKMRFSDVEGNEYVYDVSVDKYLGEGSSCICYEVTVRKNEKDIGQKRVLKQFYPDPEIYEIDTQMIGLQMDIKGYSDDSCQSQNTELTELGQKFEEAYEKQVQLANNEELSDFLVRPELCYFNGVTKYVLYEADYGTNLDLKKMKSLDDFLKKMCDLAFALQKLHNQKTIYMDLKPENILVSGSGRIKLIDFDASQTMDNIKSIKINDLRCSNLCAPEIENFCEFEQDKCAILNERIDIYSFGALMLAFFLQRYPNEDDICEKSAFKEEIAGLFRVGRFRGELTEDEQRLLNDIIWKCIQKNIGPNGRYCSTKALVRDLERLRDLVLRPDSRRKKVYKKETGRYGAAYVMDKYPLSDFRKKNSEDKWVMDSLILGDDFIGGDFFSNILACSQMLDTKHVIRMALPKAERKLREYIDEWPLLTKTTEIFLNDERIDGNFAIDKSITQKPFAEIRFYDWDTQMDLGKFYDTLANHSDISWIVVSHSDIENNLKRAEKTAEGISSCGSKFFIAYLDGRGDGSELRVSNKEYSNGVLYPFSNNKKHSYDEENFQKEIGKRAFLLHKCYMREWNESAGPTEVKEDFTRNTYNMNSSLCSVLSIPYKLRSIGIETSGSQAADEYRNLVLDEDNPSAKKRLNQLIYLEHRRWMCFMLTEGYDAPSKEALKQYAFKGDNDQRNKIDKLHPCICDCDLNNGICLEQFPHDFWERPNFRDLAKQKGIVLDGLDTMSVQFHQLCNRIIKALREDGAFDKAFSKLEKEMKAGRFPAASFEILGILQTVSERMLDNESNINSLWKETCDIFEKTIKRETNNPRIYIESVLTELKELKRLMRVVIERNSYHDYKSSDRTILEMLPLLMISDGLIRRIHKPVAGKAWQNIASSMIIEPEELYLYTNDKDTVDLEFIEKFLKGKRGINLKIQIKTMEELRTLSVTSASKKSVLDITGLPAEETYEITQMNNLQNLPVIAFKEGKIHRLKGESEVDYYGALRRHLTVSETFGLHHANIYSEDKQNLMLGLASNYENIWNAYSSMSPFRYRILVNVLRKIESGHYWKLDLRKKMQRSYSFERKRVQKAMIQDAGIDKVLEDLFRDKWIGDEGEWPRVERSGCFSVKNISEDVKHCLEKMFDSLERHPYMHKFVYIKTQRNPFTGKPSAEKMCYIYDDTLVVDEFVEDQIVIEQKRTECREEMEGALKALLQEKKKEEPLIIDRYDGTSALIENVPDGKNKFKLRFQYCNEATKECFMKEGNILEAYVYHSIWKKAFVDDVKLNVAFTWDSENSGDALQRGAITNEIDLVCTRNMQTYFISCKQAMPETKHLQEIKYFADYFGIDGIAILVTTNWRTNSKNTTNECAGLISTRSQKMRVFYIDLEMLGDNMKKGNLIKYIQNIFDGKKDWKNINN